MGNRNPKVRYTLRIVAGAYVAYLGITSTRTGIKEGSSIPLPLLIALGVLLTVLGVIFLVNGLMGYKYIKDHPEEFEDPEDAAEEETADEEEPEEAAPVKTGIMARASMPEYLQVSDEDEDTDEDAE